MRLSGLNLDHKIQILRKRMPRYVSRLIFWMGIISSIASYFISNIDQFKFTQKLLINDYFYAKNGLDALMNGETLSRDSQGIVQLEKIVISYLANISTNKFHIEILKKAKIEKIGFALGRVVSNAYGSFQYVGINLKAGDQTISVNDGVEINIIKNEIEKLKERPIAKFQNVLFVLGVLLTIFGDYLTKATPVKPVGQA